jgi:hypothetical protein
MNEECVKSCDTASNNVYCHAKLSPDYYVFSQCLKHSSLDTSKDKVLSLAPQKRGAKHPQWRRLNRKILKLNGSYS